MPARFQQNALQLLTLAAYWRRVISLSVSVAIILGIIVVGVRTTPLAEWAA